ncbi:MAG: hypothetical protein KDA67_05380 [Rhodobacteraceae bacterium]|nr:hypothetical protein [Paracoccaceae bacterium]
MNLAKICPVAAALAMTAFATMVSAAELPSAKDAAKQLYKTGNRSTEVRILHPELVPEAYKGALEKAASIQHYYEALAASPTEGMLAPSAVHAINHHTAAAAHAAAIAGCNAKKKAGSDTCVVVAEFLPKAYRGPGGFSLSYNATEVFRGKYRRAAKPKAFAISAASGEWGQAIKAGSDAAAGQAALADCAAKAVRQNVNDCVLVSRD